MADNDNVSVSEARLDASDTGQTSPRIHAAEDVHSKLPRPQMEIDTSATTPDQQQPQQGAAMPSDPQSPPLPSSGPGNTVKSPNNGDGPDTEGHGKTNNVSAGSLDRPLLREEDFEEVRLDTKGQAKPPQGN